MDFVGYVGGSVLGVQMVPQIYKVVKTGSSNDISIIFLLINIFGLSCIVMYAVDNNDGPIYIPASISIVMTIVLLIVVLWTNRKTDNSKSQLEYVV